MYAPPTGRVYSPSSTEKFLKCPTEWWLARQRKVEPICYSFKELAGLVGSAFSTFMEYQHAYGVDVAQQRAHYELAQLHTKLQRSGRYCYEPALAFESQLETRLNRFINTYLELNPIPVDWTLFDPETTLTEFGNCRLDTMARTGTRKLAFIDWKTRGRINSNQVESTRTEFATSHQLMHYAWAASQVYDEFVAYSAIMCVALEPEPQAYFWVYPVSRNVVARWADGMACIWQGMELVEQGLIEPAMAAIHTDKFGPCAYRSLCFNFEMDFDRAKNNYVELTLI